MTCANFLKFADTLIFEWSMWVSSPMVVSSFHLVEYIVVWELCSQCTLMPFAYWAWNTLGFQACYLFIVRTAPQFGHLILNNSDSICSILLLLPYHYRHRIAELTPHDRVLLVP